MEVTAVRFDSGERMAMLLDGQGVPVSSVTLFSTVRLRNAGLSFNSIRNKLYDLKVLLAWQQEKGRDLDVEIRQGKVPSLTDVVSIRDFTGLSVNRSAPKNGTKIVRINEASLAPVQSNATVSKQVQYSRLSTIADYLEFVGQGAAAHQGRPELARDVDRMVRSLRQHRPRGMASTQDEDLEALSPPTQVIEAFVRVGSEGHPENPFRAGVLQRRNELIFRILWETGIRRGELLSLRIDKMSLGEEPYIAVVRTQDDKHDSRTYQPVAKTKERILPISDGLAKRIHDYCMEDRANTPGANKHPYLFVVHRKGETCGKPLAIATLGNKVFGAMQRVRSEFAVVHPHSFRHHMNNVLSGLLDERNRTVRAGGSDAEPMTEAREMDLRAYLNGHRSKKSGAVYNRRHVRREGKRALQDLQKELMAKDSQSEAEDD